MLEVKSEINSCCIYACAVVLFSFDATVFSVNKDLYIKHEAIHERSGLMMIQWMGWINMKDYRGLEKSAETGTTGERAWHVYLLRKRKKEEDTSRGRRSSL